MAFCTLVRLYYGIALRTDKMHTMQMIQMKTLGKQTVFGVLAAIFVVVALLGVAVSLSSAQSAAQAQVLPPGSEAIQEISGEDGFSPGAISPSPPNQHSQVSSEGSVELLLEWSYHL